MRKRMLKASLAGAGWLLATSALALPQVQAPRASRSEQPMSMEQAVRQVQQETHGRILAADSISRGATIIYRIKVLTPRGKIKVVQLRADAPPAAAKPATTGSDQGDH